MRRQVKLRSRLQASKIALYSGEAALIYEEIKEGGD